MFRNVEFQQQKAGVLPEIQPFPNQKHAETSDIFYRFLVFSIINLHLPGVVSTALSSFQLFPYQLELPAALPGNGGVLLGSSE